MRRTTLVSALWCVLLAAGLAGAGNLFTDTFDRPDSTDIDASTEGMSGTVSTAYMEVFEGSGAASSIQILNNQLQVAVGNGMSNLYLNHNFLESRKFSISLDVIELNSVTSDIARRFAGFGLGMTLDEANNVGDVGTSDTTMVHPDADTEGVTDFFLTLSLDGFLRVSSNGQIVGAYDTGQVTGTIMAQFEVSGFNAGDAVAYTIYFDGVEIAGLNGSFAWDNTDTSYVGISCRTSGYTIVDNLVIRSTDSTAIFPDPENGAEDLTYNEEVLSWEPGGDNVVSHDVYLGTAFADVNNADRNNPLGVLVSQGQDANSYDPGVLDFGATYYWRVDEVLDPAGGTITKGDIWSFRVEPEALAAGGVVATSNLTATTDQVLENIVDGSGLDADGLHSTDTTAMWAATKDENVVPYVQFELDQVRKLHEMRVWNQNSAFESLIGIGVKDATIEYSVDGIDWTVLGDVQLAQGPGTSSYAANSMVDMEGVAAKYVRLTVNSTWIEGAAQVGLSEVRLMYTPTVARTPEPVDGDTDVSVDRWLDWHPGRDAATHDVYLSTDADAVLDGTALIASVTESQCDPGGLDLNSMYYWKVNEVNEAEAVAVWEGDLWSFSTQESILIDDFEIYTDDSDAGKAIWQSWVDGIDDEAMGGSQVGHSQTPFAESTIVQAGSQSMPFYFSNTEYSYSQATHTFDNAQDWTAHNIQSLVLYLYGDPANSGGDLYVAINDTKIYYDSVSDVLQRLQWVCWPIDLASTGADLANVTSLSIGIEGAGASGMFFVDTVRLYAGATTKIQPTMPSDSDANLAAYYAFDGGVTDSTGAYNATVTGSPEYEAGHVGQAIGLNGVNDTVVNSFAAETLWPAGSVSLWTKAAALAQPNYASVFNNNSSNLDFQIDVDGTDPGNYRYHGSVDVTLGAVTTEWTHLAISCDGTRTKFYFNGLYVDKADIADTNFGQIAFGVNRAGDVYFNGLIDEARLYNRALSDGEVAALADVTESILELF